MALKSDEDYLEKSYIITIPLCYIHQCFFCFQVKIKVSRENAFLHLGFYLRYILFFKDSSKNFTGSLMISRVLSEVFSRVKLDFHGKKIDNSSLVEYVFTGHRYIFLLFFHTEQVYFK